MKSGIFKVQRRENMADSDLRLHIIHYYSSTYKVMATVPNQPSPEMAEQGSSLRWLSINLQTNRKSIASTVALIYS
jgi:hypothetical protein